MASTIKKPSGVTAKNVLTRADINNKVAVAAGVAKPAQAKTYGEFKSYAAEQAENEFYRGAGLDAGEIGAVKTWRSGDTGAFSVSPALPTPKKSTVETVTVPALATDRSSLTPQTKQVKIDTEKKVSMPALSSDRSSLTPQTQEISAPRAFYSPVGFEADAGDKAFENSAKLASAYGKILNTSGAKLEAQYAELEAENGNIEALYAAYEANPTAENAAMYNSAIDRYNELVKNYEADRKAYDEYAKEGKEAYGQYEKVSDIYSSRIAEKANAYNEWRRTVRSPEVIAPEIEAVQKALDEAKRGIQALETYRATKDSDPNGMYDYYGGEEEYQKRKSQIDALESKLSLLNEEKSYSDYFTFERKYTSVMSNPDFAERSKYEKGSSGFWVDPEHEIINGKMISDYNLNGVDPYDYLNFISDDERSIYNYLYNTRGKEAADEYISQIKNDLEYRRIKGIEDRWTKTVNNSDLGAVGASAFSVITSPLKGASLVGQWLDLLTTGKIDENASYNDISRAGSAIRGAVSEKIEENYSKKHKDEIEKKVKINWGKVGSFAYQTGMSMADNLFQIAITGRNENLVLAIMGTGAAADATIAAKDRGLNDKQAALLGAIAGGAEILTEKVSLDALFDKGLRETSKLKYWIKNAFEEGKEEVASDFINLIADVLVSKDKSEWRTAMEEYKKDHPDASDSEAFSAAFKDTVLSMGTSFLGGFLSGAGMAGGAIGLNAAANAILKTKEKISTEKIIGAVIKSDPVQTKNAVDNMIKNGKLAEKDIEKANKILKKLDEGKTLSKKDVSDFISLLNKADVSETATSASETTSAEEKTSSEITEGGKAFAESAAQNPDEALKWVNEQLQNGDLPDAARTIAEDIASDLKNGTPLTEAKASSFMDAFVSNAEGSDAVTSDILEDKTGSAKAEDVKAKSPAMQEYENNLADTLELAQTTNDEYIKDLAEKLQMATSDLERSGLLSRASQNDIDSARRLSRAFGVDIMFFSEDPTKNGQIVRGLYDKNTIWINTQRDNKLETVFGHELTHSIEGTDAYEKLKSFAFDWIGHKEVNKLKDSIASEYQKAGIELDNEGTEHEIVANFISERLFTDPAAVEKLLIKDEGLFNKIRAAIDKMLAKLGRAKSKERTKLLDARKLYRDALAAKEALSSETSSAATLDDAIENNPYLKGLAERRRNGEISEDSFGQLWREAIRRIEEDFARGSNKYSISPTLKKELEAVLDGTYDGKKGEVVVGTTSEFLNKTLGASVYENTMPETKAYAAMVSWQKAKSDGKYKEGMNYHNLGVDGLIKVLTAAEKPVFAFVGKSDSNGNKRNNRIVLVTDEIVKNEKKQDCYAVVIVEVNSNGIIEKKHVSVNKTITAYGRTAIAKDIIKAAVAGRLLFQDKKRSQQILAGVQGYNSQATIRDVDFNSSIHDFWENVNTFSKKNEKNFSKNFSPANEEYSISPTAEAEEKNSAYPSTFGKADTMEEFTENVERAYSDATKDANPKALNYLKRQENDFTSRLCSALSVPYRVGRELVKPYVRALTAEYMQTGEISDKLANAVFKSAYDNGVVVSRDFYDTYKPVKDYLRTTAITLGARDQADTIDYNAFRRDAFGSLKLVKEGGLPVDSAYMELHDMAPALFPEDITHPADQIMKMLSVSKEIKVSESNLNEAFGEENKRWAYNSFRNRLSELKENLNFTRKYIDSLADTAAKEVSIPNTAEEVLDLYKTIKNLRRDASNAMAKNVLTEAEKTILSAMLRGDISENQIPFGLNEKAIKEVYEASLPYETAMNILRRWNAQRKGELRTRAREMLSTADEWKEKGIYFDKKTKERRRGMIPYIVETMERNVRDVVPYADVADEIVGEYFTPIHRSEAQANRYRDKIISDIEALKINMKVEKGNSHSEDAAIQFIGEAESHILRLEENSRIKMSGGFTLTDWRLILAEFKAMNPNLDYNHIDKCVKKFREIYNKLFEDMNKARVMNGYEPVEYRYAYFPHFKENVPTTVGGKIAKALGIPTDVSPLPTEIAGRTESFKPGIRWLSFINQRIGTDTDYSAIKGMQRYLGGVSDVIFHTSDIQRLRALATELRLRTSDEGIKIRADKIFNDEGLSEEEIHDQIELLFSKGRYELSNFTQSLDEYTNILAGKKSFFDRDMERLLGRSSYNVAKWLKQRFGANVVVANIGSAVTNFIPMAQSVLLEKEGTMQAMLQEIRSLTNDDGFADRSDFLTNRRASNRLYMTNMDKASNIAGMPMDIIDRITSGTLVRAVYNFNVSHGMSETAAMADADEKIASLMADRSKGSMPTVFNWQNPIAGLFTQFQLEVNNQYSFLFKDLPRYYAGRKKVLAGKIIGMFLASWLFNEVYEKIFGRRSALDPVDLINDAVGDITGYKLPNMFDFIEDAVSGDISDSFKANKTDAWGAAETLAKNVAEELPFVGGLLGGGRIPISSALPDVKTVAKAVTDSEKSKAKKIETVSKELITPLFNIVPPFAGGQVRKMVQGTKAVIEGGSYVYDNDGKRKLQYPVATGNGGVGGALKDIGEAAQAITFGKNATRGAREWVDSDFATLSAKKTAMYETLHDEYGISKRKAEKIVNEMTGNSQEKTDYLRDLSIDADAKEFLYTENVSSSAKAAETIDKFKAAGLDFDEYLYVSSESDKINSEIKAKNNESAVNEFSELVGNDDLLMSVFTKTDSDGSVSLITPDYIGKRTLRNAGYSDEEISAYENKEKSISKKFGDSTSLEYAKELEGFISEQKYSPEAELALKDIYVGGVGSDYEDFKSAGLSDESAYKLTDAISNAKSSATDNGVSFGEAEKMKVVIDTFDDIKDQMTGLSGVMSNSSYAKLETLRSFGVLPEEYVALREYTAKYKAETGKTTLSQADAKEIIDRMAKEYKMYTGVKAALWQLLCSSSKGDKNPYDVKRGNEVYAALKGE